MSELLKLRNERKAKKPDFVRQQGNRVKKLKAVWRQPKGGQSKLRRKFKGHIPHPSMGFRSPKQVRSLHRSGVEPVTIYTVSEFDKLDRKSQGVVIGKVGKRKKLELLKAAIEKEFVILNIKKPQDYINAIEKEVAEKKKKAEEREEKKKKSKAEALKKAEEKKKEEEKKEQSEEEKKEKKTEMQKIIEKETK